MLKDSRALALAVLCAGMLMIILDGSIVTVAMPSIQRDLHFSASGLTWTVNAYMIAFGGLLLLAGRLGDLIGRKRMFIAGTIVFTVASLLCGLATSAGMLIAARFAQGVGGAMASAVSLGMLVTLYPEPDKRAKAIGAYSFVGAAGASIGQVLGGVLTQAVSWHWIFLVNLPIGVAATVLAVRILDGRPGVGLRAGADALGTVLVTSGLMLGIYTIVQSGGPVRTTVLGVLSVALLTLFVIRQATAATPLLPLRVFASRNVSGANGVQMLMVAGLFSFQVIVTLYMQNVLGYGAAATGFGLLPAAVGIGGVSLLLSARLNARFGLRPVLLTGMAMLVAGLLTLTRLPVHGHYLTDLLPMMLLGSGFGLAIPALTTLGMSGATPEDAGVVSGLFNTTQQVGAALGVAVLTTLAAHHAGATPGPADLTSGYRLAFGIGAALLATGLVVALAVLRSPSVQKEPKEAAEPIAA